MVFIRGGEFVCRGGIQRRFQQVHGQGGLGCVGWGVFVLGGVGRGWVVEEGLLEGECH